MLLADRLVATVLGKIAWASLVAAALEITEQETKSSVVMATTILAI